MASCSAFDGPVIAKLTPNVTRIGEIALAAEAAGATRDLGHQHLRRHGDRRARPSARHGHADGGHLGPGHQADGAAHGLGDGAGGPGARYWHGGISTAQDALEFILAGATAVALGTANFTRPTAMHDTIAGLSRFLDDEGVTDVRELIGTLRYDAFGPAATQDAPSANGAPDPHAPLGQPAPISGIRGGTTTTTKRHPQRVAPLRRSRHWPGHRRPLRGETSGRAALFTMLVLAIALPACDSRPASPPAAATSPPAVSAPAASGAAAAPSPAASLPPSAAPATNLPVGSPATPPPTAGRPAGSPPTPPPAEIVAAPEPHRRRARGGAHGGDRGDWPAARRAFRGTVAHRRNSSSRPSRSRAIWRSSKSSSARHCRPRRDYSPAPCGRPHCGVRRRLLVRGRRHAGPLAGPRRHLGRRAGRRRGRAVGDSEPSRPALNDWSAPMPIDLLIENATVVTMNPAGDVLPGGSVAVRGRAPPRRLPCGRGATGRARHAPHRRPRRRRHARTDQCAHSPVPDAHPRRLRASGLPGVAATHLPDRAGAGAGRLLARRARRAGRVRAERRHDGRRPSFPEPHA